MNRRKLPIGIQDFRTIREQDDFYYVDKTALIGRLIENGRYYFLSRPRRFGKSLLLSTIGSLFKSEASLFDGLSIHQHWDWSVSHPVVRLSFGGYYNHPSAIDEDVTVQIKSTERRNELTPALDLNSGPARLRDLLDRLHDATGRQVVVLVDEYDKPILDALEDPELAKANRDYLRGLYGTIKDCADHVRFVFVTGITMFSKVSLFAGLNNLEDISLDPEYSSICGYTDDELDSVFAPELTGLERDEIRRWYNGYNWLGKRKLYNPFDILVLFRRRVFEPHWFATASPSFLIERLVNQNINPMTLENRIAQKSIVSKFDVGDIGIDALMFQSGYLTIKEEISTGVESKYILNYPNFEVSWSLNRALVHYVTEWGTDLLEDGETLLETLAANDFDRFKDQLYAFICGLPNQLYRQGQIDRLEAHYASMLYMLFRALGVDLRVEESSSHGDADMVVFHGAQVFVFEFKVVQSQEQVESALKAALDQIVAKGYAHQYLDRAEPIFLIAMVFGRTEDANIVECRVQSLNL